MVRIPVASPSVNPAIADQPNLVGDGFTAPGKALQQLGSTISSVGEALGEEQNKETDFNDNMEKLKFSNAVDLNEIKSKQTYTGDGNNYAIDRSEAYQNSANDLFAKISPRGQQKAALFVETKRGSVLESAARHEGEVKQGVMSGELEKLIGGEFGKLVDVPPENFKAQFDLTVKAADAMIDTSPLPVSVKEHHRERAAALAKAVLEAPAKQDPKVSPPLPEFEGLIREYSPASNAQGVQGKSGSQSGPSGETDVPGISVGPQSSLPVGGSMADKTWDDVPRDGNTKDSREFGGPRAGGHHAGIDVPGRNGDPVMALSGGTVIRAGQGRGYGNMVDVQFEDGTVHRFAHLQDIAPGLKAGDKLSANAVVGELGHSGNAGAEFPHLHLEVFPDKAAYDKAKAGSSRENWNMRIDPRKYYSSLSPSATAPDQLAAQQGGISPKITAYSPQATGSKMEGGYAAAKPGPDGKAEVRTLADLESGKSDYITFAGDRNQNGKVYTIPEITFTLADGRTITRQNVKGVVHDTGSAFKGKGDTRFDIPVDRDLSDAQINSQPFLSQKITFIPGEPAASQGGVAQNGATPVQNRGLTQYAGLSKAGASDAAPDANTVRAPNTIPGAKPVQVADASGSTVPQAPSRIPGQTPTPGMGHNQPPAANRSSVSSHMLEMLIKELPAVRRQYQGWAGQRVQDIEKAAAEGYAATPDDMAKTMDAVKKAGTPELAQRLQNAVLAGAHTAALRQQPPEVVAAEAMAMRQKMLTGGATPALIAQTKATEELAKHIDSELDKNPITWGVSAGIIPDVQKITTETLSPEVFQQRAAAIDILNQHYGRDLPLLSSDAANNEVDTVKSALNKGGGDTIKTLGMMYESLGDKHMLSTMKQIDASGAPELAMTGWLAVHNPGSQTVKDLATALKLKTTDDFKALAPSSDQARGTAIDTVRDALGRVPEIEARLIPTANLLYEAIAQRKGLKSGATDFSTDDWKSAFRQAAGENTDPNSPGKVYGGFAEQDSSWLWRSKPAILVPTNIDQKMVPDLIGALKVSDLVPQGVATTGSAGELPATVSGGMTPPQMTAEEKSAVQNSAASTGALTRIPLAGAPVNEKGQLISLAQLRNATLVTVGYGKYRLALGDPSGDDPKWVASPGTPDGIYVLDLVAHEPLLKALVPSAYRPK